MPMRERVCHYLGDLDDELVAKIIATGASEAELAEAAHWLRGDIEEMEQAKGEPSSRAVRDVIYLVSRVQPEEEEQEEVYGQ